MYRRAVELIAIEIKKKKLLFISSFWNIDCLYSKIYVRQFYRNLETFSIPSSVKYKSCLEKSILCKLFFFFQERKETCTDHFEKFHKFHKQNSWMPYTS